MFQESAAPVKGFRIVLTCTIIACSFIFIQLFALADENKWIIFAPPGQGFQVLMPGIPKEIFANEDKQMHEHKYVAHFKTPSRAMCTVEVNDIDAKLLKNSSPDEILNSAVKAAKDNQGNNEKIIGDGRLLLQGNPGRDLIFERQAIRLHFRFLIVKDRFFDVSTFDLSSYNKDMEKFLNSFKLTEKP